MQTTAAPTAPTPIRATREVSAFFTACMKLQSCAADLSAVADWLRETDRPVAGATELDSLLAELAGCTQHLPVIVQRLIAGLADPDGTTPPYCEPLGTVDDAADALHRAVAQARQVASATAGSQ